MKVRFRMSELYSTISKLKLVTVTDMVTAMVTVMVTVMDTVTDILLEMRILRIHHSEK